MKLLYSKKQNKTKHYTKLVKIMKCYNCKEKLVDDEAIYKFCGHKYCYDCLIDYVRDECEFEAIGLWIEQNAKKIQ